MDVDGHADFFPVPAFRSWFVGIAVSAVMCMMVTLTSSWIAMIVGGKTANVPQWLKHFGRFSLVFFVVGEQGGAIIEYYLEGAHSDPGAYSGTCNGLKNGLVGLLLAVWSGMAVWYGSHIKQMLASSGTSDTEAKKIGGFCIAIGVCCGIGCLYKSTTLLRIGSVQYELPPCEHGMVSVVGAMILVISNYAVYATWPTDKKLASANKTPSTTTSSSSVAPE